MQVNISIEDNIHQVNNFIKSQPYGLVYYTEQYLNILREILPTDIKIVCCYGSNNEIVGIMPLAFKSFEEYTVINSLPFFGSHGSPLLDHNLAVNDKLSIITQLLVFLEDFCKSSNITAFTIVTNPFDKVASEALVNAHYFTYQFKRVAQYNILPRLNTDDSNFANNVMQIFEDPRPRNIRKAIKSGVTTYVSNNWDDFIFLYETSKSNMQSKSMAHKELSFYETLYNSFNEGYKLYIAKLEGKPIGALLNLYYNGFVEYFVPASIDEYRNYQPASLLIFEAISDAIKSGSKIWNWGGSGDGTGGVYEFKKKWGAFDHDYYYLNKIFNASIKNMPQDYISSHFKNFFVCPFSELKSL